MRKSIGTALALVGLAALAACSAQGSSAVIGPRHSSGSGGDTTTDDTSATDPANPSSDPSNPVSPDAPVGPLADGLAISEIAFFQGVKVSVFNTNKWVAQRNAPVVAGRQALVRVYVTPQASWKGGQVTAELRLVDGNNKFPVVTDTKTISKASTDSDINSTFNLQVPASSLTHGATIRVALTSTNGTTPSGPSDAQFPKDGTTQALGAQNSGKVKVVVVPVKYMADGSGRTPDVSASQLALYQQTMMARYPASDVEVTARAPWTYSSTISGSGSGFSQVLNAVTQLRRTDGVGDDVYYYGALAPTSSFNSFCGGGCVTGLSTVVDDASTAIMRASVGIGFTGGPSAETMAHEVGHAHGRNHAPCGGAQGVDPQFPYAGGGIGVWGYDMIAKTLYSPSTGTDMMGYCDNAWLSDYTYSALFDRISEVNQLVGGAMKISVPGAAQTFRLASIDETGAITWADTVTLDQEPAGGQMKDVSYLSASGTNLGTQTAHFYPYDHLPGGVLIVPESPRSIASASTWSSVKVGGVAEILAR
jgi:hypothetical protein